MKRRCIKDTENLDELKRNSCEIKIEIHNKKMKNNKPKELMNKVNLRNRNSDLNNKMSISMNYNSVHSDKKTIFQNSENKDCDCNCIIY